MKNEKVAKGRIIGLAGPCLCDRWYSQRAFYRAYGYRLMLISPRLFIKPEGSPSVALALEERAKARLEVDSARNDLKWALEEQKKLEKEIQREKDR